MFKLLKNTKIPWDYSISFHKNSINVHKSHRHRLCGSSARTGIKVVNWFYLRHFACGTSNSNVPMVREKFPRELIKISHYRNSWVPEEPQAISYYHEPLVGNENCNKRSLVVGYCYFIWKRIFFIQCLLPFQ